MAFQSYIDPIETLVDRYFEKRRALNTNKSQNKGELSELRSEQYSEPLPGNPVKFLYNDEGDVYKFIHGDYKKLEQGFDDGSLIIWQEEVIKDAEDNVIAFEYSYPDGTIYRENYHSVDGDIVEID